MRRMRSGCWARAVNGNAAAEPTTTLINSRRVIAAPEAQDSGIVPTCTGRLEEPSPDVRFGSKAGISGAQAHVRFTPNSDRESRLPQPVMSALPPKADMCGALAHVCFGPKADIAPFIRLPDRHAIGSLLAIQCQLLSRS